MVKMANAAAARGSSGAGGKLWVTAAAVLAIALVVGAVYLKRAGEAKMVDEAGCLINAPTPTAALFLVDATDRLTPETAKFVIATIRQQEGRLPRYSRVILIPFGDDTAKPLDPLFSACLPGASRDAGIDENGRYLQIARDKFDTSLGKLESDLVALPPSKSSPIAAQVVRAAANPVLKWTGGTRRLVLLTDGLETSIYHGGAFKLSEPPSHLLDGVEADYVELGNVKNGKLQTDSVRQHWKEWLESAGATVRMTAPGYASN